MPNKNPRRLYVEDINGASYSLHLGDIIYIPLSLYTNYCDCYISWLEHVTPLGLGFITLDWTPQYVINPGLIDYGAVGSYTVGFYTCNDDGTGACLAYTYTTFSV